MGRGPRGQWGLPLGFWIPQNWDEVVTGEKAAGNSGWGRCVPVPPGGCPIVPSVSPLPSELHSQRGYLSFGVCREKSSFQKHKSCFMSSPEIFFPPGDLWSCSPPSPGGRCLLPSQPGDDGEENVVFLCFL